MSHEYVSFSFCCIYRGYNFEWKKAQSCLEELLSLELNELTKPIKVTFFNFDFQDPNTAFVTCAKLFVQYIQIFRSIERCYDQIVHPQKRILLRRLLDGIIGRILELKVEMVNLELSEYHYFDDILSEFKLTPTEMQIPIPKYYVMDAQSTIRDRHAFINSVRGQMDKPKFKVLNIYFFLL